MASIGGSVESVSLDGRTFAVAADADVSRALGGKQTNVLSNGDGSARQQKTRTPWTLSGLQLVIDDDRGDQEFLQAVNDGSAFVPVAVRLASGEVYQGLGTIAGDEPITASMQTQIAEITLSGPRKLTKQ